ISATTSPRPTSMSKSNRMRAAPYQALRFWTESMDAVMVQRLCSPPPCGEGSGVGVQLIPCHCEERSDEAIQTSYRRTGLLRFARNDGTTIPSSPRLEGLAAAEINFAHLWVV